MKDVLCGFCKENVTPRLWINNDTSLLCYREIEHLCPLCGSTMYVSGGGLNFKAIGLVSGLLLGFATLSVVGIIFFGVIGYFVGSKINNSKY